MIPLNRELLDYGIDEFSAHCENEHRQVQESLANRAMTRIEYRRLSHYVREFFWRVKRRPSMAKSR